MTWFDSKPSHQFELLVSCDLVIQKTELMRIDRMRFAAEWFSVIHRTAKQVTVGKDRHLWIAGVTVAHLAYIQKDGVRFPGDPPILDERSSELYADATAVRRATKEAVQKGRTDRILVPLQHRVYIVVSLNSMTRDFDSLIAGATPATTAKRDNMQTVFVTQSPATVYKTKADYLLSGLTVCLPTGCF